MRSKPTYDTIRNVLGIGDLRQIISSCFLIIASIFYIYIASSQFHLEVYPLSNRVTFYAPFDLVIISQTIDLLIVLTSTLGWLLLLLRNLWVKLATLAVFGTSIVLLSGGFDYWVPNVVALTTLPILLGMVIYNHVVKKKILVLNSKIFGTYFGLASLLLATYGLIIASTIVLGVHNQVLRNYGYEMYLIFFSLSPFLILVLVASLPIMFIIQHIKKTLAIEENDHDIIRLEINKRNRFLLLSAFMLLSILLNIIPHLQTINNNGQLVGTDTQIYANWLKALQDTTSPQQFLEYTFVKQGNGDRPFSLIFIHFFASAINQDVATTIEYLPFILGPALVIVAYLLTREITLDERVALIASFVTAVSFQTLVGIYAGFYANWIAITVGYLCIVFLLKYLKNPRKLILFIFTGLTIALIYSHVYTWSVLTAVMAAFLIVSVFKKSSRRAAFVLLIALLISVVIDLVRISFTESTGGIEADLKVANTSTSPDQFSQRWNNLRYTSTTQVAGILGNVIILGLGIYWLFKAKIHDQSSILMLIFFSLGLLPIIFGDWIVQTRILYNIPFQIPAAFALSYIKRGPSGSLLFFSICIWLSFLAVRTVSNFYFVSPS